MLLYFVTWYFNGWIFLRRTSEQQLADSTMKAFGVFMMRTDVQLIIHKLFFNWSAYNSHLSSNIPICFCSFQAYINKSLIFLQILKILEIKIKPMISVVICHELTGVELNISYKHTQGGFHRKFRRVGVSWLMC